MENTDRSLFSEQPGSGDWILPCCWPRGNMIWSAAFTRVSQNLISNSSKRRICHNMKKRENEATQTALIVICVCIWLREQFVVSVRISCKSWNSQYGICKDWFVGSRERHPKVLQLSASSPHASVHRWEVSCSERERGKRCSGEKPG